MMCYADSSGEIIGFAGRAQLWFDRMTLLQQTEAGIKLLPDARGEWSPSPRSDV